MGTEKGTYSKNGAGFIFPEKGAGELGQLNIS
jgi:hypothetical protein